MLDIWYTFSAMMGENQAWITYNHGYAEVAETDSRLNSLQIKLTFKNPTDNGFPTNEEFQVLSTIDESLDENLSNAGGVYVGRLTVNGYRIFYFYVDFSEEKAAKIIHDVSDASSYRLQYIYETDSEKKHYWNDLYPTQDDWQVIQDLNVLDSLADEGDIQTIEREIKHWAYFPTRTSCDDFTDWVRNQNYKVYYNCDKTDDSKYLTLYSHIGTTTLSDITNHTINSNRKARELGGEYDGWETSVERN